MRNLFKKKNNNNNNKTGKHINKKEKKKVTHNFNCFWVRGNGV